MFCSKDTIGMRINCVQNMSSGRLNDFPDGRMIIAKTDIHLRVVCKYVNLDENVFLKSVNFSQERYLFEWILFYIIFLITH